MKVWHKYIHADDSQNLCDTAFQTAANDATEHVESVLLFLQYTVVLLVYLAVIIMTLL